MTREQSDCRSTVTRFTGDPGHLVSVDMGRTFWDGSGADAIHCRAGLRRGLQEPARPLDLLEHPRARAGHDLGKRGCLPSQKKTTEWVEDRTTNTRRRRSVDCWDVGGRADGVQWLKRFPKAGFAQAWKEQFERDFTAGLPFDLLARRFVEPVRPEGP